MLIKLGIIGTFLILGGMMFSTEISTLFPNTSTSLLDALKSDMNYLNEKHIPTLIYYKGFWNVPFFKPERADFTLKLKDYKVD